MFLREHNLIARFGVSVMYSVPTCGHLSLCLGSWYAYDSITAFPTNSPEKVHLN